MQPVHDLTLLGFGPHAYPMLVELAAACWKKSPEDLRVQVIHNLPVTPGALHGIMPEGWPQPSFKPMASWEPGEWDGVRMPGVLREPAVSLTWEAMQKAKGLKVEELGVLVHPSAQVAPSAELGPGTWVQPHATVATMSKLGPCCYVNRHASVGHHNVWGAFQGSIPERIPLDLWCWANGSPSAWGHLSARARRWSPEPSSARAALYSRTSLKDRR